MAGPIRSITLEELLALEMLHSASVYLAAQFDFRMSRAEAQACLEARAILFKACNKIFAENGCGISAQEVAASAVIDRELA